MPEQRRRHNHSGVVAAAENLYIRSARERCLDPYQDFAGAHFRHGHRFQANVFLAVKDGRSHRRSMSGTLLRLNYDFQRLFARMQCSINAFLDRPAAPDGKSTSPAASSPLKTRRADSACRSTSAL